MNAREKVTGPETPQINTEPTAPSGIKIPAKPQAAWAESRKPLAASREVLDKPRPLAEDGCYLVSLRRALSRWSARAKPNGGLAREGRNAVDINVAIDAYSYQGGNRIGRLQAICADTLAVEMLVAEISGLQESINELVRARARVGGDGLSRAQIEQVARQYLAAARPDVNEAGLHGLLRYVIWIAWHDGWLQLDNKAEASPL